MLTTNQYTTCSVWYPNTYSIGISLVLEVQYKLTYSMECFLCVVRLSGSSKSWSHSRVPPLGPHVKLNLFCFGSCRSRSVRRAVAAAAQGQHDDGARRADPLRPRQRRRDARSRRLRGQCRILRPSATRGGSSITLSHDSITWSCDCDHVTWRHGRGHSAFTWTKRTSSDPRYPVAGVALSDGIHHETPLLASRRHLKWHLILSWSGTF